MISKHESLAKLQIKKYFIQGIHIEYLFLLRIYFVKLCDQKNNAK